MSEPVEILSNMFLGMAQGKDINLIKADALWELRLQAHESLMKLADECFEREGYTASPEHITHEMLTNLELNLQEMNHLLRAILTALTASTPVDDLFPGDDPLKELEAQLNEPEAEAVPA